MAGGMPAALVVSNHYALGCEDTEALGIAVGSSTHQKTASIMPVVSPLIAMGMNENPPNSILGIKAPMAPRTMPKTNCVTGLCS